MSSSRIIKNSVDNDHFFKSVLRSFRGKLRELFLRHIEYSRNFHRKTEVYQIQIVRAFLNYELGLPYLTDKEVAIALLLIYPAKGPSTGKKDQIKKKLNKKSEVYKLLGDHGMLVYKKAISENNTIKLRDEFFNTRIIRLLWAIIAPQMIVNLP